MFDQSFSRQNELEFVSLEELVPQDHLLRKIDAAVDLSFICSKVRHLYCPDNGRPCLDPVVLFKMLLIGYLFGIRSERQLVREIEVNLAYRWFLGLPLRGSVPHHSTISQNRRRRFTQSAVYQEIFDEIVLQAVRAGLADGPVLYTDSTHLKASANKNRFEYEEVERSTKRYMEALEADINIDREARGKKPLREPKKKAPETRRTKVSRTDPDSGYMVRDGKPRFFFYLDHRTVDGRFSIITNAYVTAGNVHDSVPYLDRLDRQCERFGFTPWAVGLDAGYFTAPVCKGLDERAIKGVMSYSRPVHRDGYLRKKQYRYDRENDCYLCPAGQPLYYRNTTREGYREYASNGKLCATCPLLDQCTQSRNHVKVITRHVWQESKEKVTENRLSHWGRSIYKRRKETVERSFADAKQLHGHRYARLRGLEKVQEQSLLCCAAQNIKKIATQLWKQRGNGGKPGRVFRPVRAILEMIEKKTPGMKTA